MTKRGKEVGVEVEGVGVWVSGQGVQGIRGLGGCGGRMQRSSKTNELGEQPQGRKWMYAGWGCLAWRGLLRSGALRRSYVSMLPAFGVLC